MKRPGGHGWLSFVWAGDVSWVTRNLQRVPRFYGITFGWWAVGIVVFIKNPEEVGR